MKILHALRGLEATSGISTFVVELCNHQARAGHQVCFVYQRSLERGFSTEVLILHESELGLLGWRPDVVHVHAIWTPFSVRMLRWCAKNSIPYIVSPHGCLMPRVLQKGRLKKWIFLNLLLRPLLNKARCWHCTGKGEITACQASGFDGPFSVVPLGCNLPEPGAQKKNIVLFLGRISEEKGLRLLLCAWKALEIEDWALVLAGPDWFGERKVLEEIIKCESIPNVCFAGAADEKMKDKLYREAKLFVLPSPMENFSAVVLEALAYSIPVIATKGTPWQELQTNKCGWWIDHGQKALETALKSAISLADDVRVQMGARGRELVAGKYSWDKVSASILTLYEKAVDMSTTEMAGQIGMSSRAIAKHRDVRLDNLRR